MFPRHASEYARYAHISDAETFCEAMLSICSGSSADLPNDIGSQLDALTAMMIDQTRYEF